MSKCQNVRMSECQIVKMSNCQNFKMSESKCKTVKLSKCKIVNQIVTISNVMYYQSVWIRLAHQLYTDVKYL